MTNTPLRWTRAAAVIVAVLTLASCAADTGQDPTAADAKDDTTVDLASVTTADGLQLSGPAHVSVGEPFTVTTSTVDVDGAAAFEGLLRFDDAAASFGGVASDDSTVRTLVTPQASDGVALASYRLTDDGTNGALTLVSRFTATKAGRLEIALDGVRVVDTDGGVLSDSTPDTLSIQVDDGEAVQAPSGSGWELASEGDAAASLDLTDDGNVSPADVSEVTIGWSQLRTEGDPCAATAPYLKRLDVDGSGCIDISDVSKVAGSAKVIEMATPLVVDPPFVVNTLSDATDSNVGDNVCAISGGGCSLRAAIVQANKNTGPNRVEFNLPGAGVQTIQLTSPLPTIHDTTGGLTIDGYTQPGATPNTDPLISNAQIKVEVRGLGQSGSTSAFNVTSANNVFRGLAIYNVFYGISFVDNAADGNTVVGSYIGTNAAGTYGDGPSFTLGSGLWYYNGASGNTIGTPALADRNVISGNKTVGIKIEQFGSANNVVKNNIIGLNPSATNRIPNNSGFDLQWNSANNIIGGAGLYEGNLISGNAYAGVDLSHTTRTNKVVGNRIGTTASGSSKTSWSANADGILIKDNPTGNTISGNVLSGNAKNGIWGKHNYTDRNYITNNRIGVGLNGSSVPNGQYGIWLTGEDHQITGNVIANNPLGGIFVSNANGDNSNYPAALTRLNRISANSFYDNGGLAIDIAPAGTNPNDAGDADAGIQDLLNFPEVTSVATGSISGNACAGCTIELYIADGAGEGRQVITTAIADGAGAFTITDAALADTRAFTTLAIDPTGNTSEFSPAFSVASAVGPWVTPTELNGGFSYQTISGRQVAVVQDRGIRNDDGPGGTSNTVRFVVDAPVTASYTFEAEVTAPSGNSDSHWVQVDGQPSNGIRWDVSGGSSVHNDFINSVGGADPYSAFLTAGQHTVLISMREDGTGIATLRLVRTGGAAGTGLNLTAPADQLTALSTPVDLLVDASDPDNGILSFSALGLPPGLTIDQRTGRITGTTTTPGTFPVSLLVTDGAELRQATFTWVVPAPNSGPIIQNPGAQSTAAGTPVTLAIFATDPDNDAITYGATGLPAGLSIDPATGLITGTSTVVGVASVTVTASDPFAHQNATAFAWTITPGPFTCSVDGPTSTLSWTNQSVGGNQYYVRHIDNGVETYIKGVVGFSTTVSKLWGTYKVTYVKAGVTYATTCPGPNPPPTAFTCSVDGTTSTLSWTDQAGGTYYIRHIVDGVETYLKAVTGTSTPVTKLWGTYKVSYIKNGATIFTTCPGPNPPPTVFTCSVDGTTSTLSWTDQSAGTYYIRHIVDGVETYLKAVTGTSTSVTKLYGTYKVSYIKNGVTTFTTCDGPGAPPVAFACGIDVATATLSWTNQGQPMYYIRRVNADATETYLGGVNGLSTTIAQPDRPHTVTYQVGSTKFVASCSPPPPPG